MICIKLVVSYISIYIQISSVEIIQIETRGNNHEHNLKFNMYTCVTILIDSLSFAKHCRDQTCFPNTI